MMQEIKTQNFIVAAIAEHQLALPLEAVLRVLKCSPGSNSELNKMGLIQLENYLVRTVDLYQYLGIEKLDRSSDNEPIVIITANEGNLYGILIDEPPTLMRFSLDTMQVVPESNHQSRFLNFVTHAIVNSQSEAPTTIFLLDIKRVLDNI